ncbi:hypothetical protein ACFLS9_03420 [Bacteroidota bacterium]
MKKSFLFSSVLIVFLSLFLSNCDSLLTDNEVNFESQNVLKKTPSGQIFVQSFNPARASCNGGFGNGNEYSMARFYLQKFGFYYGSGVDEITADALADVDIFVIVPHDPQLKEEELCILEKFVELGGAVLDIRNMHNVPLLFGVEEDQWLETMWVIKYNETNPEAGELVKDIYGSLYTGNHSTLTSDEGIPFLKEFMYGNTGYSGLVFPANENRSGRAVLIGDEELFMSSFPPGCTGVNGIYFSQHNPTLLQNIFDYLSKVPGLEESDYNELGCFYKSEFGVMIDIKPGSDPNSINLKKKGLIPVAILTVNGFNATTVDPLSVKFGPGETTEVHGKGHIEDVDDDGDMDLLLHFHTQKCGLSKDNNSACIKGLTFDGTTINGCDAVRIVGKK